MMNIKRIAVCVSLIIFIIINNFESFAAYSKEDNLYAVSDGGLFDNLKGLVPGDEITNIVHIRNDSKSTVTLYLKVNSNYEKVSNNTIKNKNTNEIVKEADKKFKEDLLDVIKMNIKLDDIYIYGDSNYSLSANCNGEITSDKGISLGEFKSGTERELKVSVILPDEEMNNSYMDSFHAIDWVFYIEGEDSNNSGSSISGNSSNNINSDSSDNTTIKVENTLDMNRINQRLGEITSDALNSFNIVINDNQIPLDQKLEELSTLAKTGDKIIYLKESIVILILLVISLGIFEYADKRCGKANDKDIKNSTNN